MLPTVNFMPSVWTIYCKISFVAICTYNRISFCWCGPAKFLSNSLGGMNYFRSFHEWSVTASLSSFQIEWECKTGHTFIHSYIQKCQSQCQCHTSTSLNVRSCIRCSRVESKIVLWVSAWDVLHFAHKVLVASNCKAQNWSRCLIVFRILIVPS